tara:strand:+ start:1290 stop:1949 length:660 start_codon:yes stop_codon:yes gene_type:complete
MNRDFKGIWIPKEIWLNEKLTIQEKIFLVEIDSLDNESGCFAGNAYFSEFFGISKTRVSLVIKSLIEKGFVSSTTVYKEGTKQILKRVLNICYRPYTTKVKEGTQQKLKDNNTSISNTVNNTNKRESPPSKKFTPPTLIELSEYMQEQEFKDIPSESMKFMDHYESVGWMVSKNKMRCWKAAVRNWKRRINNFKPKYEQQSFLDGKSEVKINGGSFKIG